MVCVAEHTADEANIGELCHSIGAAVAFVEDVLGFDEEAKLRRCINTLGDWRIETVQAIEKQYLICLELDRFAGETTAFFKAVNWLLDRFAVEQRLEMTVEQLDVEGFGRLVIAIVNPVGRVLDEG